VVESGVKGDSTRMLFVGVRRSLRRIAADAGLMVGVAQGSRGGWRSSPGELRRRRVSTVENHLLRVRPVQG
jgi:hypothetical protein